MKIMFDEIKKNDLLIVKKSFYCSPFHPNSKDAFREYYDNKIKKESIILILENSFGKTRKERFIKCLANNKQCYFNNNSIIFKNSLNECFEKINK